MIDQQTSQELIGALESSIDNAKDLLHVTKQEKHSFKSLMVDVLEREIADFQRLIAKLKANTEAEAA